VVPGEYHRARRRRSTSVTGDGEKSHCPRPPSRDAGSAAPIAVGDSPKDTLVECALKLAAHWGSRPVLHSRCSRLVLKTFTDQTLRGALTCPRWPASPAQRQLSDWYRCLVAMVMVMVMVMPAERCPVVVPAWASPAERQLSDQYRCSVAMAIPSD